MKPEINIYPDYNALSLASADRVIKLLSQKPGAIICLPSGSTPLGMFQALVSAKENGAVDFSQCHFIGLDEWIGLGKNDEGSCRDLLDKDFLIPLALTDDQITFFNGKAKDPQAECDRTNEVISSLGGLDLIVLGVGMNGHLALNEPGTSWDSYAHISDLDTVTIEVGQKYFKKPTILKQGITIGIRHIIEAKKAILVASGSGKAPIIKRALEAPITPDFPATTLQNHSNVEFILDKDAARDISQF